MSVGAQTPLDPALLDRVKTILRRDLKLGPDAAIPDQMPFFGGDVDLDSLDMLLLVTSVEKEFGLRIPNEAVGREVFESIASLTRYIQQHAPTHAQRPPAGSNTTGAPAAAHDPLSRLPHREPFRFITALTSLREGESAEGVWDISGMEAFFAGHFPGKPIVPGVLIAEALAQISGIAGSAPGIEDQGRLAQVDVRFEESVVPPAQLVLKSKLTRTVTQLQQFDVSAYAGSRCVARGTLTLARGGVS